jgi:hypothetical protein
MRRKPMNFIRFVRGFRLVAWVAIAVIALGGLQPVLASSEGAERPADSSRIPHWNVQVLDANGRFIDLPTPPPVTSRVNPTQMTAEAVEQLRHQLIGMKFGLDRARVARAEHLLTILDIVTTKDRAERHRRIQQLGVTITETAATDGRKGTIKTFIAGGAPRARLFVPAKAAALPMFSTTARQAYGLGGPSDSADQVGRWKSDGNGGCYYDAYDEGPDQCEPPTGRWKVGSTCYWDPNDSGPDQCAPTGNDYEGEPGQPACSYQGQPEACASVQDGEDVMALASSMEADLANAQADYDSAYAYCEQYGCEDELPPSGPSADSGENCWLEGLGAAVDLGLGIYARVQLWGLGASIAADAAAVAVSEVAGTVIVATATVAGGVAAVYGFVKCMKRREPAPAPVLGIVEPAFSLVD